MHQTSTCDAEFCALLKIDIYLFIYSNLFPYIPFRYTLFNKNQAA